MDNIVGMRDRFGADMRRQRFFSTQAADVAESFGYEPLSVSLIERAEAYSEEIVGLSPWPEWNSRGCFFFELQDYEDSYNESPGITNAVLIPEGTLSVTRWLGAQLTAETAGTLLPMKIYYNVQCFRNELVSTLSATKGREFTQFGVEIIGAEGAVADVEPMVIAQEILSRMGLGRTQVAYRISSNRLFLNLARRSGLGDHERVALKELLDTIAECKAGKRPQRMDESLNGLTALLDRVGVQNAERAAWMLMVHRPLGPVTERDLTELAKYSDGEVEYLKTVSEQLNAAGILCDVDYCVVRSHEYYTGLTFEVDLIGREQRYVEVGGGGRYDRLLGNFVAPGGPSIVPSTGFAFGIERLLSALAQEELIPSVIERRGISVDLAASPTVFSHRLSVDDVNDANLLQSYCETMNNLRERRLNERISVEVD